MKHLIVGCGCVGKATATFLEAQKEDVYYYDANKVTLDFLTREGKKTWYVLCPKTHFEVYWICTPETEVENVLKMIPKSELHSRLIVVRSTTVPGTLDALEKKYKIENLAHNPEFLREKTATEDTFFPDRIIIGSNESFASGCLLRIYKHLNCPIVLVNLRTSELIKQISNAYLATQISFWNEVKSICDAFDTNPQMIANAVTLDKRISKYGSIMTGQPFSGKCLPKDLGNLLEAMKKKKIPSYVLHSVRNLNDWIASRRRYEGKHGNKI